MTKPTANTAWATDESAKRVEPLESQRQSGWVYQDTPSSGVVNGWMNAVHQWLRYFESLGDPRPDIEDLQRRVQWLEQEIKNYRKEPDIVKEWEPKIADNVLPIFEPPREIPPGVIPPIHDPFPEPNPKPIIGEINHVDDDFKRPPDSIRPTLPLGPENLCPKVDGQAE